ncbi:MAG: WecB/TagA/CpsF family glycosyltransferase [Chloroflexi bacterium]|nr:WecB/TagA/CpsF family glycosyltransferase [Chloroflexota bacterium]
MAQMIPRADLLGVKISTLSFNDTIRLIAEVIAREDRLALSPSPVYTVMQGYERDDVRQALNANLAAPDGMPVVWALRLMGHQVERVYGPDIMQVVCARSIQEGWRHFFYGGTPDVVEKLIEVLKSQHPNLLVAGFESPPFRELTCEEDEAIVKRINESKAHIVWVGLGSPKQDMWMADHRARLTAPVLIGVGAAFDFFSGRVRQAPRWMQRSGLEWLYRLMSEPSRLWRRYLIYNPKFVVCVLMQIAGLLRFDDSR